MSFKNNAKTDFHQEFYANKQQIVNLDAASRQTEIVLWILLKSCAKKNPEEFGMILATAIFQNAREGAVFWEQTRSS